MDIILPIPLVIVIVHCSNVHLIRGTNYNIMGTDVIFLDDDIQFDDNTNGIQIHAECLSQDFDDIAWEPEIDDTPDVDPSNDIFGYYK